MKVIPFPRKAIRGSEEERLERMKNMSAQELSDMLLAPLPPRTVRIGAPWTIREDNVYRESLHDTYVTGKRPVSIHTGVIPPFEPEIRYDWLEVAPGVETRKRQQGHDTYIYELRMQKKALPMTVIWEEVDRFSSEKPLTTIYMYDDSFPANGESNIYGGRL